MRKIAAVMLSFLLAVACCWGQDDPMNAKTFAGMKFRNVGPAFTSGRIADIAFHPDNENTWYVAVGSGGVWKTENGGTTWKPIFDNQPTYSIGCITIDPSNPHTIWVGTGENVGGRHVGYGDGIYKSEDNGKTWKNMGLKASEHISKIAIHPENSDVIWVAVQGPLWNKGGERGLYKSTDGGENWKKVLGDEEWTGVTDIVLDPRDPNWMYAATWQRHRTVAAYLGGGPGSGIHRSTDGGETWEELKSGIPNVNKGKIGLAISPQNPDRIYAAIELLRTKGGIFMSENRGKTWVKQSDAVAGGTGPHYYQELYASPHKEGRLYLANNSMLTSDDHFKTYRPLKRKGMHSDSHAIAFKKDDPNYILVGTDGGLYESLDLAENWRFIDNMPITQYYKLAVDDSEPFYNIYGGTQDNGSHGGPSRTDNEHGIRNADWWKTLFADGHQSAIEPGNPNITYAETQQGGLHRIDQITGEQVLVQPQPGEGEDYERYNWDAPILVSSFDPARLYFASSRVWRSTNRGDSWEAISGDLTRDEERISLPIMGGTQSWDNAWDVRAMSNYNTITSLGESPKDENIIYAGTDDGIVQVTEDGGKNWRKIMLGDIKDVPARAFVNDIRADLFDASTVYLCLDNHKEGDFKPYVLKSTNRGKTWTSISSNIPDRTLIWRIVQDHVDPNLLFLATEYGIYFTHNGGDSWIKFKGGLPTISFRDITIQRRENDLVGASFGRSFFVLDDISPLRNLSAETFAQDAHIFDIKDALWYKPRSLVSSQGTGKYVAENPPFGAVFTYYLRDDIKTLKQQRMKAEKKLAKNGEDIPFPGWDALEKESRQEKPQIILTIKDANGQIVNKVKGRNKKGINRVSWNLMYASKDGVRLEQGQRGRGRRGGGMMSTPGTYTVTLSKLVDGKMTDLTEPKSFEVKPLRKGALPGASMEEIVAFRESLQEFQQDMTATSTTLRKSMSKVNAMYTALNRTSEENKELFTRLYDAKQQLMDLEMKMGSSGVKGEIGERSAPGPWSRYSVARRSMSSTYGPSQMHKDMLALGQKELAALKGPIKEIVDDVLPKIEADLMKAGAPWIEGQGISED
ncbi:MAG: glycosyl hydrolase [Bacteroidota bacterium]